MEDTITLDGRTYVAEDTLDKLAYRDDLPYVLVRTRSAGVFAGYLANREGTEGRVIDARRIWYWDGAASLSELSLKGPSKPATCKFPASVEYVDLTEIVEVLPVTEAARVAIAAVAVWSGHAS